MRSFPTPAQYCTTFDSDILPFLNLLPFCPKDPRLAFTVDYCMNSTPSLAPHLLLTSSSPPSSNSPLPFSSPERHTPPVDTVSSAPIAPHPNGVGRSSLLPPLVAPLPSLSPQHSGVRPSSALSAPVSFRWNNFAGRDVAVSRPVSLRASCRAPAQLAANRTSQDGFREYV